MFHRGKQFPWDYTDVWDKINPQGRQKYIGLKISWDLFQIPWNSVKCILYSFEFKLQRCFIVFSFKTWYLVNPVIFHN